VIDFDYAPAFYDLSLPIWQRMYERGLLKL